MLLFLSCEVVNAFFGKCRSMFLVPCMLFLIQRVKQVPRFAVSKSMCLQCTLRRELSHVDQTLRAENGHGCRGLFVSTKKIQEKWHEMGQIIKQSAAPSPLCTEVRSGIE